MARVVFSFDQCALIVDEIESTFIGRSPKKVNTKMATGHREKRNI